MWLFLLKGRRGVSGQPSAKSGEWWPSIRSYITNSETIEKRKKIGSKLNWNKFEKFLEVSRWGSTSNKRDLTACKRGRTVWRRGRWGRIGTKRDWTESKRDRTLCTVEVRQDKEQLRGWISSRRRCKKSRGEAGQCEGGWISSRISCTKSSSEPGHMCSGQEREAIWQIIYYTKNTYTWKARIRSCTASR